VRIISIASASTFALESVSTIEVAVPLAKASAAKFTILPIICILTVSIVSIYAIVFIVVAVYFIIGFL
jgi:hypothetical protein